MKRIILFLFLFFATNISLVHADVIIGHWKFDAGTGDTAADSSGNFNSGTFTPTAPTWSETVPDVQFNNPYSLDFTGAGDGVDIAWPVEMNFEETDPRSFSFWYKPTANGEGSYSRLISWSNDQLEIAGTENGPTTHKITYYDGDWHATDIILSIGTWYHVTFTYDGTTAKFYIGGELQDEHPLAGRALSGTMRIGNRVEQLDEGINGLIDDVRIYDYALNATQVENLSIGSGNPDLGLVNPTVISATPLSGSVDIAIDRNITIDFSEPIDPDSLLITTSPCITVCTSYDISWADDHEEVNFWPAEGYEFSPGTTYTVSIMANDEAGNPMDEEYDIIFTTEGEAPSRSSRSSGSSVSVGCNDPKAINYNQFSLHDQTLCKYNSPTPVVPTPNVLVPISFNHNLSVGSRGEDVNRLQEFLVKQAVGPASIALKQNGLTYFFGRLTLAAVIEFQKSVNILPSAGFFGPITRAYINTHYIN